jgi:SAM-dependent methyltransferase
MLVNLNKPVEAILCCPLCKGDLKKSETEFSCLTCGVVYAKKTFGKDHNLEHVFDFRIQQTDCCMNENAKKWLEIQTKFERSDAKRKVKDQLHRYLDEIDSVREIYTQEYSLEGSILDVGGHQGRLRHFLDTDKVPLYVCVDPYLNAFENITSCSNLIKAYPSLAEPCNFLACHAENLPFKARSFDWVHMRSVLDHFHDPYKALLEINRWRNHSHRNSDNRRSIHTKSRRRQRRYNLCFTIGAKDA